jgi:hypothetical protein
VDRLSLPSLRGLIHLHRKRSFVDAFPTDRVDLLALTRVPVTSAPRSVPVPDALAGYRVEAARVTDYDVLLASGARR